jgi:hypothetical protein
VPSPTEELAEKPHPKDNDHNPGGISNKVTPVMVVDVIKNGTDGVNAFIVEPISNRFGLVKLRDTNSPLRFSIYRNEPFVEPAIERGLPE